MINNKIKVNEIELNVTTYKNNGESIIFLHCSRGNSAQWNGVVPYFKEKHNIVIPDLRGHGKSDKAQSNYHLDDFAKDIKDMMDELGIEKAHLVGSSMGGEIAVAFGANYPEKALSIACEGAIRNFFGENGFFNIPEEEIPAKKKEVEDGLISREHPKFDSKEEMLEAEKKEYEEYGMAWNEFRRAFSEYDVFKDEDDKYTYSCPTKILLELTKGYFDIKFEDYFRKIKCPVLFLPSKDEANIPEAINSIKGYRELLQKSDMKVIDNSIHAQVMLDYPKEFSDTIIEFHNSL